MSKRQWMVLLMLFLTYLLLGASIFYHIESRLEIEKIEQTRSERIEINALLEKHYKPQHEENQDEILKKLTQYCGKSVYNYSANEIEPLKWDFYNSFYFAYTVVSTIGYGNLAPTNMLSRILMIFYGVIGIPMNGILLAQLGEFFSIVFIRAHQKYKSYKRENEDECAKKLTTLETRRAGLAVQIMMYLLPGFVMFIFFPAFLFSYFEGWTYEEAVYYAFVTLTTIGFGDYVAGAGQDNTKGSRVVFILYKSFLIAWISFGLGYVLMIMTFITRGMRSKKIIRLEKKLAQNLKQTQSKIWNEFNKEVGYLRRVFNELQLSKVKRIYVDEYDDEYPPNILTRSNSFPDLRQLVYGGLNSSVPLHPRRRANSEVVPMERPIFRVVSETDLQRIDKNATFATHAMVQPAELLARLVNILGYIPPPLDDDEQTPEVETRTGVQCFSDKEILATEKDPKDIDWSLGGDKISRDKPRSRATSEVNLDPTFEPNISCNQEWTWSGPAASHKIQEIINARRKGSAANKEGKSRKESKSLFPGLNIPKSVQLPRWMKHISNKKDDQQRERNSVSVGDLEDGDDSYLPNVPTLTERSNYFTHTGAANLSSTLESSNLLEETSLADFLRALTALHTQVGAVPDEYVGKPQRKMGTACLTPPKLPNLLALFSPPSGTASAAQNNQNTVDADPNKERRFSLRTLENSTNSTPLYCRRNSLAPTGIPRNRRFSLRPVTTSLGTTPQLSPYLSGQPRKQSASVSPPPPYNAKPFIYECPREPLVKMEGATGVSTPVTAPTMRRFSLRPAQIDVPPGPATAPVGKGMPRWRAGMLQRHINQLNLQRRVRALSLGDVNSPDSVRSSDKLSPVSPLALDPMIKTTTISSKDSSNKISNQKTVTIVSPSKDDRGKTSDNMTTQANQHPSSFMRSKSVMNNPFTSIDTDTSSTNPFVIDMSNQYSDSSLNPSTCEYFATDYGDKNEDRTIFQVLSEVKNIETSPTTTGQPSDKSDDNRGDTKDYNYTTPLETKLELNEKSIDKAIVSGITQKVLSNTSDLSDRSNRAVSTDNRKEGMNLQVRKVSTVSEVSTSTESLESSSRKSSSSKCSNDKPRVSIDSYKSLAEIKIDKPRENPFEKYSRVSMQRSTDDIDVLSSAVDVQSPDSSSGPETTSKLSMNVDGSPGESTL